MFTCNSKASSLEDDLAGAKEVPDQGADQVQARRDFEDGVKGARPLDEETHSRHAHSDPNVLQRPNIWPAFLGAMSAMFATKPACPARQQPRLPSRDLQRPVPYPTLPCIRVSCNIPEGGCVLT